MRRDGLFYLQRCGGNQRLPLPFCRSSWFCFEMSCRSNSVLVLRARDSFTRYEPIKRKRQKVRTLLVAIFGVRFIMVGMEVVVPLVTSRMLDAAAKIKTGSAQKVRTNTFQQAGRRCTGGFR